MDALYIGVDFESKHRRLGSSSKKVRQLESSKVDCLVRAQLHKNYFEVLFEVRSGTLVQVTGELLSLEIEQRAMLQPVGDRSLVCSVVVDER